MTTLTRSILSSPRPLPVPILASPGARLVGATVQDIVTDAARQTDAQVALHTTYRTPFVMSAMDLSVEAEEFGAEIRIEGDEIPTVVGRLLVDAAGVRTLPAPRPGSGRTALYLDVVRRLSQLPDRPPVLGGMIGPFSLAARLFGVSEALLATAAEPETIAALVQKATAFLTAYARAFREAGAAGLVIAEPTAGLMSPGSVSVFSSPYLRQIVAAVQDEDFTVILHNCGARLAHLGPTLEAGAAICHFGKPMDIAAALARVPAETVLCGNLDPAEVFVGSTADQVARRTAELLRAARPHRNFVISSGCDIPVGCPPENLEAFFATVRG